MLSEVKPEIEAIFKGVFEAYSVPSIPKHVRKLLRIDAPVITWGNQVLFFQQSQISDMTKLNGTVTSFRCDFER